MKQRNSNIEILRILGMMGVIALHYVHSNMGGVEAFAVFPGFTWLFVAGVRSLGIPLVNTFILITGYFMISSKDFSLRKPIDLLTITMFYGFVFYFVEILFQGHLFSLGNLMKNIFPFFFGSAWFVKTYVILYLLAPYLNKALAGLEYRAYMRLMIIQISLFSVWYSIGLSSPVVDDGYGIINFVTLYLAGGFIRRFGEQSNLLKRINKITALVFFFVMSAGTFVMSVFINSFGYAFITNVLGSVFLMIFFVKLQSRSVREVNVLASKAFDVFFVHTHLFAISCTTTVAATLWVIPHMILFLTVAYLIGWAIGTLREYLFSLTLNRILDMIGIINKSFSV